MVWGTVAGIAAPIIGRWISGAMGGRDRDRNRRPTQGNDPMAGFDARVRQIGTQGQEASAEGLERMRAFDPMAAATQASQAQYNLAMPQIERGLNRLRGQQVGQGRLRTGYGQSDQDQFLQENYNNLNQSMVARAMQAASMAQANNQALAGYGQNQTNTYLDASLGRYMSERDREDQERASRRGMWGNLLGAGIGALGTYAARKW